MLLLVVALLGCREAESKADPRSDTGPTGPTTETTETGTSSPTTSERAPGIHALDGTSWDLADADLEALDPVLASAELVAVGESVHYSDGYHRLRARVLRYLVEAHEVRFVAVEGHWYLAESYTRPWVEGCEGSAELAVAGLTYDVWASTSSRDVMQFLCDWNTAHPTDPVRFVGVDVQAPWYDSWYLDPLFDQVDPIGTEALRQDLAGCFGYGIAEEDLAAWFEGGPTPTQEGLDRCAAGAAAGTTWLEANADGIAAAGGDPTLVRVALRSAEAGTRTWLYRGDWDPRDRGMAENLLELWAARAPGERGVYWAHNAHIVKAGELLSESVYPLGWIDAGSHLSAALGDGYVPLALVADEVLWTWAGMPETTSQAEAGSVERVLARAFDDDDTLFVDVETATRDGSVLDDAPRAYGHPGRAVGVPSVHWAGVLWLRHSASMERMPWRTAPPGFPSGTPPSWDPLPTR
jgi:erythromycin esterase-like protein